MSKIADYFFKQSPAKEKGERTDYSFSDKYDIFGGRNPINDKCFTNASRHTGEEAVNFCLLLGVDETAALRRRVGTSTPTIEKPHINVASAAAQSFLQTT
jgi:hypothetical protein